MYSCIACCNLSFFISNFVYLILLLFFLMTLAEGLSILFIFSKNQLFVWLIFTIVYFFFIYFCSDLYDFFLSTNFGDFVLLFPVVLGVKLGCLFDVFLVSWGRIVLLWTSLLELLLLHPISFELSCFHCHLFLESFWFLFWFLQ